MQLKEKGVKDLEHWLDTLATRVENCSLILVGTKLDLVKAKDISQFEDRMIEEMETLLASKPIYQKIKVHKVLHFSSSVRYKDFASCKFNKKDKRIEFETVRSNKAISNKVHIHVASLFYFYVCICSIKCLFGTCKHYILTGRKKLTQLE